MVELLPLKTYPFTLNNVISTSMKCLSYHQHWYGVVSTLSAYWLDLRINNSSANSAGTLSDESQIFRNILVFYAIPTFFSYILISASVFNIFNRLYNLSGKLYATASTKSLGSKLFIKKRKRKSVIRPWNNVSMNAK